MGFTLKMRLVSPETAPCTHFRQRKAFKKWKKYAWFSRNTTCALELARPHALSRCSTLGAVRRLTAGLGAVTRQEDLPLVDPAVVFRRAADRAADTCAFGTVCAPLTLQRRLDIR